MKYPFLFAALGVLAIAAGSVADDEAPEKPPVTLKVGDPAPALGEADWLQGDPVAEFKPGQVYVVEFWATWCGPCIASMPHTAELVAEYEDPRVTVIAWATADDNNTAEDVAEFVKKRGPKLGFRFAFTEDRTTYDAWLTAAGKDAIPYAFVVDKAGRIAYIGHPIYLGAVLPNVMAGNMTPQQVTEEAEKVVAEFHAATLAMYPDAEVGLAALAKLEAKHPEVANTFPWIRSKLSHLPKLGRIAEAKAFAEAVIAKGIEQEDPSALGIVAGVLRNGDGKKSKELMAVAVKAAEAELRLSGDDDAFALISLASTYHVAGDTAKAKEYARKAVEAAAGERDVVRESIEQRAREIEDGRDDD